MNNGGGKGVGEDVTCQTALGGANIQYCADGKEFDVDMDETYDDEISKSRLATTIISLLQIKPSLRRSASNLLEEFIRHSEPTQLRPYYLQIYNRIHNVDRSRASLKLDGSQSIAVDSPAGSGHFDRFEAMPDENLNMWDYRGKWEELQNATKKGYVNMIQALKEAGGDISAKDSNGWTLMHIAAHNGHVDVIRRPRKLAVIVV